MWEDPIVSEVRQVREDLARQFDFEVGAIFADLRQRQVALGSRLVRQGSKPKADQAAATAPDSDSVHPGR